MTSKQKTEVLVRSATGNLGRRKIHLTVLEGHEAGTRIELAADPLTVGASEAADLRLSDAGVSRLHAVLRLESDGLVVEDLGSTNGTWIGDTRVRGVLAADGTVVRFGTVGARIDFGHEVVPVPLSSRESFGAMLGRSAAMRATFAQLERASASDSTVLLTGESGTGKELAAQAIHDQSRRGPGSFIVVDCGALPRELIESELFGHEKGAFTGATQGREGAFALADGGTVFLDEIGELDLDLQPKLLRVLEARQVRRLGGRNARPIDIRVVAATHRNLRRRVATGAFREDLFYRLAVLEIQIPPLRERPDDIEVLVERFLSTLAPGSQLGPDVIERLRRRPWPGNVRELRNFVERLVALGDSSLGESVAPHRGGTKGREAPAVEPYKVAKRELLERFERDYLEVLLTSVDNNYTQAARVAQIDRVYLLRLLDKYDLRKR